MRVKATGRGMRVARRAVMLGIVAALLVLASGFAVLALESKHATAGRAVLGPTNPTESIDFSLVLHIDESRAHRFITALSEPNSPRYRHFIDAGTFGRRFGVPADELRELLRRLSRAGVVAVTRFPQRTAIEVRARAGTVNRLFGIRLFDHRDPRGRLYHAPRGVPQVPDDLGPAVSGVSGLSNKPQLKPHLVPAGGLSPQDTALAYDLAPIHKLGIEGQGQTMAIISFDRYIPSDLDAYNERFGLPKLDLERIPVAGGASPGEGGEGAATEVDLDIEISHSVAPRARILDYDAPITSEFGPIVDTIVADDKADIVSISWGLCELYTRPAEIKRDNHSFEAAVAAGISIFVASGDTGAYDCQSNSPSDHRQTVDWPAASPNVIAVGGTALSVGVNGGYVGETAWEGVLSQTGGGGGLSTNFPRPRWQNAEGVRNQFSHGRRQVPDVSADSDTATGWAVVSYGKLREVGGTSAAAPFWASSMLLIRQYAQKNGLGKLGYVNPMLYRLASTPQLFPPLHDVTVGTNRYYPATRGWDFATGLGSPSVYNLARDVADFLKHGGR